jgi:hypothetical protein
MNFTRQRHPAIIEQPAAHTCLGIMDALPEISAREFAFGRCDGDNDYAARSGANKLLGVLPGAPAGDRLAGTAVPDKRRRPA